MLGAERSNTYSRKNCRMRCRRASLQLLVEESVQMWGKLTWIMFDNLIYYILKMQDFAFEFLGEKSVKSDAKPEDSVLIGMQWIGSRTSHETHRVSWVLTP